MTKVRIVIKIVQEPLETHMNMRKQHRKVSQDDRPSVAKANICFKWCFLK